MFSRNGYGRFFGQKEIVELLISKGADGNAKRNDGLTPLHIADSMNHKKVAMMLRTIQNLR